LGRVRLEPEVVARMDKEMSQVSKTGVEGAGRRGDNLEAGVKAMSSGLEMGTHLGRSQPGREAAVCGGHLKGLSSGWPKDTGAPRQPAGEQN